MPETFAIEKTQTPGGTQLFRVSGHLNAASTPELLSQAREVKEQGCSLIVNMSQVSFIASSGVGALLALSEEFREANVDIYYAELSSVVDSVIRLLNLNTFLDITDSESDACDRAAA